MKTISALINVVFMLIFSVLIVTSCGTNNEDAIKGKWEDTYGNAIEFTENGVVKGLARNVDKDFVDGSYKVVDDSLLIDFIVVPEPNSVEGNLDFLILKLDEDSLVLNTGLGSLNYARIRNN